MAKDIRVALELNNRQFNQGIRESTKNVQSFERSSTSSFGKSAAAAAALATAFAGVKKGLNITATFQDLRSSLTTLFGGLQEGADAFDRVTSIAAETQFQVQDITKAFIQLKGAGIEPTKDIIMTFANAAAITTDQLGSFQAAISLLSRTTAGGLGLEELERLSDRGIPVYDILNQKLGLTRKKISEAGSSAEGAAKIIKALGDGINERFGDALANRMSNTNQRISNFNDALSILADSLLTDANAGFGELLKNLTDVVKTLNDNIERVTRFTDAIVKMGGALLSIFLGGKLVTGTKGLVNGLNAMRKGILKTSTATSGLAFGLTALGRQFGIIGIKGKANLNGPLRLLLGIGGTAGGLMGVAGAVLAVVAAFSALNAIFGSEGPTVFEKQRKEIENAQRETDKLVERLEAAKDRLEQVTERGDRGALGGGMSYITNAQTQVDRLTGLLADSTKELEELQKKYKEGQGIVGPPVPDGFVRKTNDDKDANTFLDMLDEKIKNVNKNFRSVKQFKIYIDSLKEIEGQITNNEQWIEYEKRVRAVETAFGMSVKDLEIVKTRFQELNDEISDVANFEDFEAVQGAINEAFKDGDINLKEYNLALEGLRGSLSDAEKGMAIFQNAIADIDTQIADNLVDAIFEGENAIDSLKATFKEAIKQMIADTIRLMVVQTALQAIFGFFGYSASFAPSGGVSSLTKNRQFGGPVMKNKPYIVGEDGPELFMPKQAGDIVPNGKFGGGAQQNVTYNIQAVDAPSFQALVARDPDFIHAVASKGAQNMPSGRRF